MKLWDKILQGKSIFGDAKFSGVLLDSSEQVDRPTASNIVGNLDHLDFLVFHRGKKDVVHVNKPNSVSAWWQWGHMRDIPLALLEVDHTILANQSMATDNRANT